MNITASGRDDSDTKALALAANLNVGICQIYTDVEGVYTGDPHPIPGPRVMRNRATELREWLEVI